MEVIPKPDYRHRSRTGCIEEGGCPLVLLRPPYAGRKWWHEERAKTRSAQRSLRGNVGGDQSVRRPLKQPRRLSGLVQRCADKGAVDQHRELPCECIGSGAMQPFRDDFQASTQFALMRGGELACGMIDSGNSAAMLSRGHPR